MESTDDTASKTGNTTNMSLPRLGYACLNTILRNQKPPIFCSRTCRIATILEKGVEHAKELGLQNLRDLEQIILWNEKHNITFFRMSSDMFPFASHPVHGYTLDYAKGDLARVGQLANSLGHRLTFHPGQYTQPGSPTAKVVSNSILDLKYHAEMMDWMELDHESVMILHVGGTFGDKKETLRRWEKVVSELPKNVKDRIVLENDDVSYTVRDILPTCQRMNIPLVFDWHHHNILNEYTGTRWSDDESIKDLARPYHEDPEFPSLLDSIKETWTRRGIRQKQHYSESRAGAVTPMERRAHSDRVVAIPPQCDSNVDLMIEAKDKEQAVLTLYQMFGNFPVPSGRIWEALPETMRVVDRVQRGGPKKNAAKQGAESLSDENGNEEGRGKSVKRTKRKSKEIISAADAADAVETKKGERTARKKTKVTEKKTEETTEGPPNVSQKRPQRKGRRKAEICEVKEAITTDQVPTPNPSVERRRSTRTFIKVESEEIVNASLKETRTRKKRAVQAE